MELAQKAMLRQVGIDPPKWHDVGGILLEYRELFPSGVRRKLQRLSRISKWLRKERELSFYGDIDFIPTEEYSRADALKAIKDASYTLEVARSLISIDE